LNNHPYNSNLFRTHVDARPDPGAGNNFTFSEGDKHRVEIVGCSFTFTADANAANRLITVYGYDGTSAYLTSPLPGVITATEAIFVSFGVNVPPQDLSASVAFITSGLPLGFIIEPEHYFNSNIANIQAGDTITNLVLFYKLWPTFK
jgi:hypothetical protein